MKKFLALMLSIVMVLACMTVAFADSTRTSYGSTEKLGDGWYVVADGKKVETIKLTHFTAMSVREVTDKDGTSMSYIPAYYTAEGLNEDEVLYDCLEECADYGVYHNGKFVGYVNVDYDADILGFLTSAKFVKGVKDGKCGTFANDVYVIDDVAYKAVSHGGKKASYNGKFMQYDEEQTPVQHELAMKYVTYKGVKGVDAQTPVNVKCPTCGKVMPIVTSVPKDYLGEVNTEFFPGYFVLLGNETIIEDEAKVEADKDVNSAKTFDAGVASYVGLSLASIVGLAGCGKKHKVTE